MAVHRGTGLRRPQRPPALTFFIVLTLAGGNDVLAVYLRVRVEDLTAAARILAVVAPIAVGLIAWRLGVERARQVDRERTPLEELESGS